MKHLISGLMSWMKREPVMSDSYRSQLRTWAKNEYKKDWQFAYQFMIENNGRAPSWWDINTKVDSKEVA